MSEDDPLTLKEERIIERDYDHFVAGKKLPEYRCNRCKERVNMVKLTCGREKSPSPWEPID